MLLNHSQGLPLFYCPSFTCPYHRILGFLLRFPFGWHVAPSGVGCWWWQIQCWEDHVVGGLVHLLLCLSFNQFQKLLDWTAKLTSIQYPCFAVGRSRQLPCTLLARVCRVPFPKALFASLDAESPVHPVIHCYSGHCPGRKLNPPSSALCCWSLLGEVVVCPEPDLMLDETWPQSCGLQSTAGWDQSAWSAVTWGASICKQVSLKRSFLVVIIS